MDQENRKVVGFVRLGVFIRRSRPLYSVCGLEWVRSPPSQKRSSKEDKLTSLSQTLGGVYRLASLSPHFCDTSRRQYPELQEVSRNSHLHVVPVSIVPTSDRSLRCKMSDVPRPDYSLTLFLFKAIGQLPYRQPATNLPKKRTNKLQHGPHIPHFSYALAGS
jgi:hypothetical protein